LNVELLTLNSLWRVDTGDWDYRRLFGFMNLGAADPSLVEKTWLFTIRYVYPAGTAGTFTIDADRASTCDRTFNVQSSTFNVQF